MVNGGQRIAPDEEIELPGTKVSRRYARLPSSATRIFWRWP
jgi:hypothetical protein